jgi:hypothetical protein
MRSGIIMRFSIGDRRSGARRPRAAGFCVLMGGVGKLPFISMEKTVCTANFRCALRKGLLARFLLF